MEWLSYTHQTVHSSHNSFAHFVATPSNHYPPNLLYLVMGNANVTCLCEFTSNLDILYKVES